MLTITTDDPYASTPHVCLRRVGGRWFVHDDGSKNGTFVDGSPLGAAEGRPLGDQALIELGHTFFFFRARAHVPARSLGAWMADHRETTEAVDGPLTLSPSWEADLRRLKRLALTRHEVLLEGESGTGKEVLARWIHASSGRPGRLVALNCAALPEALLEDELFGHVRGAFSDARVDRKGLVRAAHGGTLFLDEIGDMSPPLQAKLLRVLEENAVRPIGSEEEVPVDVRFVAATHRDLRALVAQGRFRQDLLARLGLVRFRIPPLRERREDLGMLTRALLRSSAPVHFELDALRALLIQSWPMNVRELRRALLVAVDLASVTPDGMRLIAAQHVLSTSTPRVEVPCAPKAVRELTIEERQERDRLVALLRTHGGNIAATARALGRPRTSVQRLIARLGVDRLSPRDEAFLARPHLG